MSYTTLLTSCPASGSGERRVHRWLLSMANRALRDGVDYEQWATDMVTHATRPVSETELRDAWTKAAGKPATGELTRLRQVSKPAPLTARELIRRGGGRTLDDLMAMSPVRVDCPPEERWKSSQAFLRALFKPDELVSCGDTYSKVVLPCSDWCQRVGNREWIPPLVIVNPLKPGGGRRKSDGAPSMICDDAVSVFRHAVVEFDNMPLDDQLNLLVGFGLNAVTAITFSGGRSLHAIVRVDAESSKEWEQAVRGYLFRRLMVPLGCDPQCQNPARRTRLAGALREDKGGALQTLLFVREALT